MKYYYDLHIHSVLSPCADVLMTPNNLLNTAMLKGLNLISITDHNSLRQYPVLMELSKSYDFILVPGIEMTTQEGIHILIYFKDIQEAYQFDSMIDRYRIEPHHSSVGRICDLDDQIIETVDTISSDPLLLGFNDLCSCLSSYQHLMFLAHLDRKNEASLHIYDDPRLTGIELINPNDHAFIDRYQLNRFRIITNSDAHDLMFMAEIGYQNCIDLPELSLEAFFREFSHE